MKKTILTALLAFGLLALAGAQAVRAGSPAPNTTPRVILAFAEDETQIQVRSREGRLSTPALGDTIAIGSSIITRATGAELQVMPNRSIVRLSPNTTFRIDDLQGADGAEANAFHVAAGKVRTVAARLTGLERYSVSTPTAVGGVRGTDFVMLVEAGAKDWICVQEGLVEYTKLATGQALQVAAGDFADTFAPVFAAAPAGAQRLAEIFSDVGFQSLKLEDVPGTPANRAAQQTTAQAETPAETPAETTQQPADSQSSGPMMGVNASAAPSASAAAGPSDAPPPAAPAAPRAEDPLMEALRKILGFQVGAITIDGVTYSQAVIQPNIRLDGFAIGLYLPVIYSQNLFDPSDWYKPRGNNEWSFGTDESFGEDWLARGLDAAQDILLKIKYLEAGKPNEDPFYIKIGNLSTMQLANGGLMRGFANDQDFPAVRRIGLNTGLRMDPLLIEAVLDDVADPSVVGGRLGLAFGGTQFGLSSVVDLFLASELSAAKQEEYGNPLLIGLGADLQLFNLNLGILSLKSYLEAGTALPYYRSAVPGEPGLSQIDQGPAAYAIWDEGLRNWGAVFGLAGNVLIVDYRLEARYTQGLYRATLFDANYQRTKTAGVLQPLHDYLRETAVKTEADGTQTLGVYGSGGFNLFDLLTLDMGYYWPMGFKADGTVDVGQTDKFEAKVVIPEGTIPFIDIHGSVSYERYRFGPTLYDILVNNSEQGLYLFDANTVLRGEVIYPLASTLKLAINVATTVLRDASGQVLFQADGVTPQIQPSIQIETRISF